MPKPWMRSLVLVGALCVSACDDDATDDLGDLGGIGGAGTGGAGSEEEGELQSGTYQVSNLQEVSNGCQLDLSGFTSTPIDNTGTTISIGETRGPSDGYNPEIHLQGSGEWVTSTEANLTASTHVTIEDCEFDLERTSQVTYTGRNAVSVNFTHTESNHTEGCGNEVPSPCTSQYTFDLTR